MSQPVTEPRSRSEVVLTHYARRMRRARLWYFGIVAIIVVALAAFAAVVWSRGEAAHVTLHTAARPAPTLHVTTPAATQHVTWRSNDRLGIGYPVQGGTVITYSQHTVLGRNARTGKTQWSYNRSDRTVCTAVQLNGVTMAIYAVGGNCNEVSAFDTDTGTRRWTRTLDEDGLQLNGRPAYTWTTFTLMMTTSSVIYAIDPSTGLDRWTYTRQGCDISRALIGTAGALISQDCRQPRCKGVAHCGVGPQLLMRDANTGRGDDSKPNADQIQWNDIGNSDIPVTTGNVVGAANRTTHQLDTYAAADGKPTGSVNLSPALSAPGKSWSVSTDEAQLLWSGGTLYALSSSGEPRWTQTARTRPTLDTGADGSQPSLASTRLSVPAPGGVAIIDGTNGKVTQTARLPQPPPAHSLAYPLGAGYVVGSRVGTVAYG